MNKIILTAIILVLLIFSGGKTLAQDSQDSLTGIMPDSPFYFIKIVKEKIQIFFAFGEENKANQYLNLAQVRMAEYQKMLEKGKTEIARKTMEKYEKQLSNALSKTESLNKKGKETTEISKKIEDSVSNHIAFLEKSLQKVPDSVKKGLESAIESSRKFIVKKAGADKERACLKSQGEVKAMSCCISAGDFPNLCFIGACGCPLENSHEIKICDCGQDKCFNGNECVPSIPLEQPVGE